MFSQGVRSIEAICSLALSLSDSRLESFRISKLSASFLTSSEPDTAKPVDLGEQDLSGLDVGDGGVTVLGSEAK